MSGQRAGSVPSQCDDVASRTDERPAIIPKCRGARMSGIGGVMMRRSSLPQNAAVQLQASVSAGDGCRLSRTSATGSKCDGYHDTRACQLRRLVMRPLTCIRRAHQPSANVMGRRLIRSSGHRGNW